MFFFRSLNMDSRKEIDRGTEADTYQYCIERKETRKLEVYETLERDTWKKQPGTDISRTSSSLDLRLL